MPLDPKMSVICSLELEITLITALPKAVLFNPLLLLLLRHQTYPSCEKESCLNTYNELMTNGYSLLLPPTTSFLRLGVGVLLVGLYTPKHGASLLHPTSCLFFSQKVSNRVLQSRHPDQNFPSLFTTNMTTYDKSLSIATQKTVCSFTIISRDNDYLEIP